MNATDREILAALSGENREGSSIDDLQGLLLQISLAIMMIFMMSFFMFRMKTARDVQANLLELNRQKLVLAADNVEKARRERYGLEALTRLDERGARVFDAASVVPGGRLTAVRHLRGAFMAGSAAAAADYADPAKNLENWHRQTLAAAGVEAAALSPEDSQWLDKRCAEAAGTLRAEMRAIQRACAVNVQRAWLENPAIAADDAVRSLAARLAAAPDAERAALAAELADALKARSVERLSEMCGAEMLK